MQYATEVTYPTPEGTSNGLIQLCGQASVVFVYVMEAMRTKDGSFTPSLLLATVLLVVCLFLVKQMKDIQYIPTPYVREEIEEFLLELDETAKKIEKYWKLYKEVFGTNN